MAYWTFPSDRQSWGPDDGVYVSDDGHPAGCIKGANDISGLSIPVTTSSPNSFWCKILWDSEDELENPVNIGVGLASNDNLVNISGDRTISSLPYDSGWFKIFGNATGTGTVTSLAITLDTPVDWPGLVYADSIYVAESEPGGYELTHSAGGMPGAVMV